MNVLYVIGGKGLKYGAEVVASNLIDSITRNYNVHYTVIINSKGVISELCEKLGIEYHVVKLRPYVYAKENNVLVDEIKRNLLLTRALVDDAIALKKIEKVVDFSKIDIVHTNLSRNMLGAKIVKKYAIPHVWHLQEMYNVHYKLYFLKRNQINYMNRYASAFVGISHTVSDDWISHGIDKIKCHTILNGVSTKETERHTSKYPRYRLVMIAEITPPKGQEFVIDALSRLSTKDRMKLSLDFVGSGKEKYIKKLKDKVKRKGLDSRIIFRGYIENIDSILPSYDILINASDGEGFGLSTAEAMMNSVCPLVSDRGANVELIKDKFTGIIFKWGNEEHFIDSLLYLINESVIEEFSTNAREYALKHFTVQRQAQEVYDLYSSLLIES